MLFFFFQAEDGIRDLTVTGVQTCALPIYLQVSPQNRVRRERCWFTAGVNPPGNWFAPPGSNPSRSGGHETAEASGAAVVFCHLVLWRAAVLRDSTPRGGVGTAGEGGGAAWVT